MHSRSLGVICFLLFATFACSPTGGTDVNAIPATYAAEYCHFVFHCCTAADRANPENPFGAVSLEQQLDFADESDCTSKLGTYFQIAFQPYQASVQDKRMTYNQTSAQSCVAAVKSAADSCNPSAMNSAVVGTQTGPGICTLSTFVTGDVGTNGSCTMTADCAATGATCQQSLAGVPDGGIPPLVTGGTCVPLPGPGQSCTFGGCAEGACCDTDTEECDAFVAEGQACGDSASCTTGGGCSCGGGGGGSCDPTKDYCDFEATSGNPICRALIANGQTCNPDYQGLDCVSSICGETTMQCVAPTAPAQAAIDICTGNPDGV